MLPQKIKDLTKQYAPMMLDIRRHLHAHPELSFHEFKTSEYIGEQLKQWNIPFEKIANTGIVALLEGKNSSSRIIALRADIDALPITEENDVPYKSQNNGVMHACGHDVHTTCLLGATKILNELRDEWEGTVKLIFQPGEEKNPGGASIMIKEGVLENPKPQAILAMHVHPGLPIGKLSFRGGLIMASADEIYITIKGKGGHAASPHLTADTILIASQVVVSLQQIVSRNANPFTPSVLSICSFNGGFTTNVIPSEVKLMGTFRTMDETWRYKAHELIKKQVEEIAAAMGAEADVLVDVGYPAVYSNEIITEKASNLAKEYFGDENIEETEIRMGAEDFGFYAQKIPACFYRVGVRNEAEGIVHNVHTPKFNVDEEALQNGAGIMAWFGMNLQP
ncbi:M20 metallopeptidase family protein [Parafilimonas terrae]|uniref:Hippurate hydrolase n=1 Tax=Parafilimonas terrae TaxID=1465490 RepID=A0A1I5YDJ5_9BACT|nr:M20 family metallopeptidase [Parafilimonas terrae]SFQ42304.1 hippurate hydrolase [Parafilimonas terrae]